MLVRKVITSALVLALMATSAHAITRSCNAKLYIKKGSSYGFPESFSGKGSCGSAVPNRCRIRARQAATKCAKVHWDIRWKFKRPEHCYSGANVHNYGLTNLKKWIENRACEKGWDKGTVKLILKTYGGPKCHSVQTIASYDMLPRFCGN